MTDETPPTETVPVPDYAKTIEELKAANVALTERLKSLESANGALDQKINALTAQKTEAAPAAAKSSVDAAYESAMRELGINIKEN